MVSSTEPGAASKKDGAAVATPQQEGYAYRPSILAALAEHGIRPTRSTPPAAARDLLNDLYRYEIRRLRDRMRRGDLPRSAYADSVKALGEKYALLSIPLARWVE
jgi:hypothetical protein